MGVITEKVEKLAERLLQRNWTFAVAESCTGGWLAKCCTDLSGSSAWFECGFVTYTNRSKREMLGVDMAIIDGHGAVSEQTVSAMVSGVLEQSPANIVVAISGIAGPGGGTPTKPVGTVCFGWMVRGGEQRVETVHFGGDREAVRRQAVEYALDGVLGLLS